VDALGNPVHIALSPGQQHDSTMAEDLLAALCIEGSVVMADKAYGSKAIREFIEKHGGTYCIPPKSNESNPWDCDWWQYKERHLVECFFQKIKQFRRVATRYDKLARRFLAFVHLACIMLWLA
jgi:transposase